MCTLILARNAFKNYPVVIAANRDEALSRPSSPPKLWDGEPKMYAPVDELAGGTWIGASERGVIAAITNRANIPQAAGRESRGTLVLSALQAKNVTLAALVISKLRGSMFNGFHLAVMDRRKAFLLKGDGRTITIDELKSGFHVITQFGVGDGHCLRAGRVDVRRRCQDRDALPEPDSLGAMLSIHGDGRGLDGTCVHMPDKGAGSLQSSGHCPPICDAGAPPASKGYGTRSSTVIRMSDPGADSRIDWWHREGRACESGFGLPYRLEIKP